VSSRNGYSRQPSWTEALLRGLRRVCPRCGTGRMFSGYLTVPVSCASCGLAFEPLRADDAPAYFTVFIVGHVVIAGLLVMEQVAHPALWLEAAVWVPITLLMPLALLPFIKGAVMGVIYASRGGPQRYPAE